MEQFLTKFKKHIDHMEQEFESQRKDSGVMNGLLGQYE